MEVRTAVIQLAGIFWSAAMAQATDFYVAPNGNNAGSGAKYQPLATLEMARDAARKAGAGPHRIMLLPGNYYLTNTFALDARDNGLTLEAAEPGRATLYGGRLVTGWRRDGEKFWRADLPGGKEGAWNFRVLVVNGRMADRARMPESGTFIHRNKFDVPWLSSVAGGWARPPTQAELTTLRYDPKDIPATLDVRNAEVRIYHMWDESLVGVVSNDVEHNVLVLQKPAKPPGAFGVKKYVIFNTREGLTRPGQWFLDRAAGRVVYWPLPGEAMTNAQVVAPVLERIIAIAGTSNTPVERITVRGLVLQGATTPLKPAGFGAAAFDGALNLQEARRCLVEKLEIANVGGQGVLAQALQDCEIRDCQIYDTGACAIRADGTATLIAGNRLHDVGLLYPGAVALAASSDLTADGARGFHIYRNEIHDAPYCGMDCRGAGLLIEENLIYRVMREVSDGAAVYGIMRDSTLRGNYVREVVKMTEGYGVSSYYLDEGSENCVVERNVSLGVERPTQNHIARNILIRNNVFMAETNMVLTFSRSSGCTFAGNTLFAPGDITIDRPPGISLWTNNVIFRDGRNRDGLPQAFTIDAAMPVTAPPARRTSPFGVARVPKPPALNGDIIAREWPGGMVGVSREPSRWEAAGAPAFASFCYDDKCLYVAVQVALFDVAQLRMGSAWRRDDGVELCLAGGQGTFVLHGFASGTMQSVTNGGVPAAAALQLGHATRFVARAYGKTRGDWKSGWRCEWAIPFSAVGLKPAPGLKVPFNVGVYKAEDATWCCLEGTLAQNWLVAQAATLQLK